MASARELPASPSRRGMACERVRRKVGWLTVRRRATLKAFISRTRAAAWFTSSGIQLGTGISSAPGIAGARGQATKLEIGWAQTWTQRRLLQSQGAFLDGLKIGTPHLAKLASQGNAICSFRGDSQRFAVAAADIKKFIHVGDAQLEVGAQKELSVVGDHAVGRESSGRKESSMGDDGSGMEKGKASRPLKSAGDIEGVPYGRDLLTHLIHHQLM